MCVSSSVKSSASAMKNHTGLRRAYQNLGAKLVFSMNSNAKHIEGVGSCVILKKPGGEGKRALVLPKQQYDKRKTSLPNMSWPTPEMYRRNGLGLLSLPEASLVKGLPPVSHECVTGPEYIREGGLRKVEPYFDTLKTHISRHYKPCGVGVNILTYLQNRFHSTPKRFFQVMLRTRQLVVNCEAVDGDYVLKEGDVIMHTLHKHEHPVLDLEVEVVHDSEEMLVVSKPSSWPVHPVSNYRLNSLSYVLRKEMGFKDLRAVHRIDAATSGICMMAKGWEAATHLAEKFRTGPTRKEYLALVDGRFPEGEVVSRKPIDRYKLTAKVWKEMSSSREAETIFRLLRYCPETDTSLVSCKPVTGRTHQIRLHLTMLGFPIVRDSLYNERDSKPRLSLSDFEHHPLLVEALDKMERELEKDKLAGEMNRTLDHQSEQCEQALFASQEHVQVEDSNNNEEEEVRFAGLAELANYKYCLQCQTSQLLGSQTPEIMCLHSHRYSIGQPGEDLTFEASAPFWAEDPTTVRPILGNKRRP